MKSGRGKKGSKKRSSIGGNTSKNKNVKSPQELEQQALAPTMNENEQRTEDMEIEELEVIKKESEETTIDKQKKKGIGVGSRKTKTKHKDKKHSSNSTSPIVTVTTSDDDIDSSVNENENDNEMVAGLEYASRSYSESHLESYMALGADKHFDISDLKNEVKINLVDYKRETADAVGMDLVFDMIGVDAPLANAFRRILLAEVPTVAIETVFMHNNTSIIPDEVLSHRLGLIPLNVDPRLFKYRTSEEYHEEDTLIFSLDVKCHYDPEAKELMNSKVCSGDLKWIPQGEQEAFVGSEIRPLHNNILIAKLKPGQVIKADCYCSKGIGQDHAKFSPVGTTFYRFLPKITLIKPIRNGDAKRIVNECPMKVFAIDESGNVKVSNPRNCTMCRECIQEAPGSEAIKLGRIRNHFIFTIESVGALSPKTLFEEAIKCLTTKLDKLENYLQKDSSCN